MLPIAAERNHRRQAAITATVMLAVRRAWRRMSTIGSWTDQWNRDVGPKVTTLVLAGQKALAAESEHYVTDVLDELGVRSSSPSSLNLENFTGVAGDGRPVSTLLDQVVVRAGTTYAAAITDQAMTTADQLRQAERALEDSQAFLDRVTVTVLADAARAAESVAMVQREWVTGWVRMINPPCCARCAILAGRYYHWNEGFDRHDLCDCRHIPATEARASDLTTNPNAYFDSLERAEQDRIFTIAGAQAIRDGADISQVVNARRGMGTAQQNLRGWIPKGRATRQNVLGRGLLTTTEGVTRRGDFGRLNAERREEGRPELPVRLMPETIYEIADDRADAIRMLETYGYVGPPSAPPGGGGAGAGGGSRPTVGDFIPTDNPTPDEVRRIVDGLERVYAGQYGSLKAGKITVFVAEADYLYFELDFVDQMGATSGFANRMFNRDPDGTLWVVHELLQIAEWARGGGFGHDFTGFSEDWYRESGVGYIELTASLEKGGYAWAMANYRWAHATAASYDVIPRLERAIAEGVGSAAERRAGRALLARFASAQFGSEDYPTPRDVATLGTLGSLVMHGSTWEGVKSL